MIYAFADCTLDARVHALLRDGAPVHVEPQVSDLLLLLARAGGELVSYDAVIESVWDGRAISDATLTSRISAARRAVGDSGAAQSIIRTVARRGLQLAVPVDRREVDEPTRTARARANGRQSIRYVTSRDGVSIAYAITGQGPPLVRVGHWLTHLDLDWQSPVWRPLLDRLGRRHTVYRYDQRAVVDATGAERVPIFTASQGVSVALKFTAENPGRVSRLVLLGGFAQGRYHRGDEAARHEARAQVEMVKAGWGRPGSPYMNFFSRLFMPDATAAQLDSFVEMMLASARPEDAARLRDVIDGFDVSDILRQVQAPVLLVHARCDAVHPLAQSQMMAGAIPDAELVVLDSANHVPLPTDPAWAVLMDETERFLAE